VNIRISGCGCTGDGGNSGESFRDDAKHRTRNLEIPGSSFGRPGMTMNYRPVFTRVQSLLMMRWVAGSRAVITNRFFSVASSG
jgi:hypothetical protein